jgi:membrane protease YdiL (CAAX protease family)
MTTTRPWPTVAAMAAALAVFVARPLLPGGMTGLLVLFGALLLLGGAWPVDGASSPRRAGRADEAFRSRAAALGALAAGLAAFALGRYVGGGHPAGLATGEHVAAVAFAAFAEELFFRRFVYGILRPGGVALAVGGSSVLFAIAHVTVYGWWVLPLDLAAGLILSWQRWASGSWAVPAATHIAANLMVVL